MELFDPGTGIIAWQVVGLSIIAIYVFTVASVALSRFKEPTHQLLWLLIVLVAPLLGTLLWFTVGRRYKAA
ncbi:MAG: PLDc N-terminal domain-containing protein [Tunicatimonas sp.]